MFVKRSIFSLIRCVKHEVFVAEHVSVQIFHVSKSSPFVHTSYKIRSATDGRTSTKRSRFEHRVNVCNFACCIVVQAARCANVNEPLPGAHRHDAQPENRELSLRRVTYNVGVAVYSRDTVRYFVNCSDACGRQGDKIKKKKRR